MTPCGTVIFAYALKVVKFTSTAFCHDADTVLTESPETRVSPSGGMLTLVLIVSEPLRVTTTAEVYDVDATIAGGGVTGQAGALRLGIARALVDLDPEVRITLKRAGLLTRDAREKESKKYGLKKARKAPQYSKR